MKQKVDLKYKKLRKQIKRTFINIGDADENK
jgi:hypothetical protein